MNKAMVLEGSVMCLSHREPVENLGLTPILTPVQCH